MSANASLDPKSKNSAWLRGATAVSLALAMAAIGLASVATASSAPSPVEIDDPVAAADYLRLSGTASGSSPIEAVYLVLSDLDSGEVWAVDQWVQSDTALYEVATRTTGRSVNEAVVSSPGEAFTSWSYKVSPGRAGAFRVLVWSIDSNGLASVAMTATFDFQPAPEPDPDPAPQPVPEVGLTLESGDLTYQGSFAVPADAEDQQGSLNYAGVGLAYNPSRESLFITGHDWFQRTGEISIPEAITGAGLSELPRAEWIQRPVDATDGRLPDIASPREETYARVGGYLVDGDELIISAYDFYDADGSQIRSHLRTTTDLGESSNMVSISDDTHARWLGGPMAVIPPEWRPSFGGDPYIGGLAGISIVSNSSAGPAAATFSPASLEGEDSARLVVGYPLDQALDGPPETQSELWNLTSEVRGIVFPSGSSSVLFFGTQGIGEYCYGPGEDCSDPERTSNGTHAYPYRFQVWAYDASDLAEVFAGIRTPESLRPASVWELDLPYGAPTPQITGVAHDPDTNRIFVSQARAEGDRPLIHVFSVG